MSSTSRAIRHGPHSTAIHRTTSLDSNVSSISSNTSNSFKPSVSHSHSASSASQDNAARQDIPSLIAAAGSAEAAIQKLLQEKASASAHTAQLWRLVEKQRAMIHGLNKDLERSLKDKERYRKKLKEHLVTSASTQSLPATAQKIGAERENSQSPALSELTPQEEIADAPVRTDSAQLARKDSEITLDSPTLERTAELPAPAQKLPGPSPLSTPQYLEILPTPPSGDDDRKPAVHSSSYIPANGAARYPAPVEIRIPTGTPPIPSQTPPPPHTPRLPSAPHSPKTPSQGHVKVGSLTGTTQMHSPQGFSSPKDRFGQPSRKAPPAPLVLSPKKAEQQDSVAVSDSEYEGSSADFPRGRRRTREEDDEEREALAIREAEHRSKSKQDKKSKSKSKSKPPQGHLAAVELPATKNDYEPVDSGAYLSDASSPEEPGSPGSPHVAQMQTYQSIGALASMVRTPTEVTVPQATKRTLVAPALMSPGLPISPRPGDRPMNAPVPRAPKTALSSIPMSPRAGGLPLSPRAPRQPIPLPPQTPLSVASPHLARAEAYHQQAQNASIAHRLNADVSMAAETGRAPAAGQPRSPGDIFRGFISEQYPDLLLPPNALPSIYVKVDSSRLRPARHSFMAAKQTDENPVFTLAVYARSDHSQLWRVEKTLFALSALDQQLKAASEFRTRLPDRGLFTGHAPARIDARRSALGLYFEKMLDTPMDEKAATIVCVFLTVDAIGAEIPEYFPNGATPSRPVDQPLPTARLRKDGYLTKRGKNFGGWKARYFLLDGPILKYYEAPGGAQLGSIKLQNAQIGKQQQQQLLQYEEDVDNQYRHAFLILEPKRKDSSSHVRHVLCAESDGERDAWVDSLLQYVDRKPEEEAATRTLQPLRDASSIAKVRACRKAPVIGPSGARLTSTPSPPITGSVSSSEVDEQHASSHPNISAPSNAHPIQNAESWGNKPASVVAPTPSGGKDKKRSIFGFRGRSSSDLQTGHQSKDSISQTSMHGSSMRGVFGVPLSEAVDVSAPTDVPVHLPAVVYRCIEYLQAKDAALEEGIFRLSGSNIVIKALRERFNNEGDVRLLDDGQYYDVHAVASLLKLYLRELPISILTREHHLDFVGCLDLPDDRSKVEAFNVLVNRLPRANRELLEALSAF
ncbi:Rho GTPase activating protein [Taxawa tesnikishii (nom. ined.)]|nr:Rho GTPase activating protein [Dothideales sp. JES 119]